MHRRDLLRLLLASPLALTIDVEQLLWVPKPLIIVPRVPISLDAINEIVRREVMPGVYANFFGPSPLLTALKERRSTPFAANLIYAAH